MAFKCLTIKINKCTIFKIFLLEVFNMRINDITGLGSFAPIITELYKDMAQPAVRNFGLALGAITSVGLFIHLLSSWGTDRLNICLKNNLEKYSERLKEVPSEDIVEAPPEVAIPIIEKLSYVTNEELRDLYIELLAKASIKDENDKAHPNFINIINSLSPDEAKMLKTFKIKKSFEVETYYTARNNSEIFKNKQLDDKIFDGLNFPKNIAAYLENFEGLGLITLSKSNAGQAIMIYELQDELNNSLIRSNIRPINLRRNLDIRKESRNILSLTNYGKLFLDAVLTDAQAKIAVKDE